MYNDKNIMPQYILRQIIKGTDINMKKIIISLLATSLLAVSLLAGCTEPNEDIVIETPDNEQTDNAGDSSAVTVPDVILTEDDGISVMNVGGKDISKAYLNYYLSNLKLQNPTLSDDEIKNAALENIKQMTAIELLCSTENVTMDKAATDYYNETIAYTIEQCNAQEGLSYETALAQSYMTDTVNRDLTKTSILASLLFNEYSAEGGSKYTPADDAAILETVKQDYVRVKHVLIKTDELTDEKELADAKVLAEDILSRAQDGENFEDLVTQYSADGMDVEKGYYFTTGVMVPEFETASFMLSVGDVAMVESTYGYHIIKKYEMLDEHILGDESIRNDVAGKIYSARFAADVEATQGSIECTLNDNYESVASEILSALNATDAE